MKLVNIASNIHELRISQSFSVFFSYQTPVVFWDSRQGWVVSENLWGPTTTRHINTILMEYSEPIQPQPGETRDEFISKLRNTLVKVRIPRDEFIGKLRNTMEFYMDGVALDWK